MENGVKTNLKYERLGQSQTKNKNRGKTSVKYKKNKLKLIFYKVEYNSYNTENMKK